ncbi:cyclodeaminase/cyclohydrolase family protein [Hyphomicrobium methylovorum]|uniref:cyclodeaminase/cyclohydrolase family protein n=1 Tax=Hyphomicrobium methylovorum TaxID=84 RepID=UPI0015E6A0BB|nr:cyclodeaminase/cyclohydrolase family protein [Hyphomicrobium methylovorum]
MLMKLSVEDFCGVLGSDAPAPGGGSVAALSGALGAELVAMVCRLSVGRKDLEQHQALLKDTLEKAQALSVSLRKRVDLDTEAFNGVMAAFRLPKATDEEKKARSEAIQSAYKEAVQSPLSIACECRDVLTLSHKIIGKSNANALSDLGVSSQQAMAGLEGGLMNVQINMPSIKDDEFKSQIASQTSAILEEGRKLTHNVYKYVLTNI